MPVERFIPNLGPEERRTRVMLGLAGLVVSAFLIAGLLAAGASAVERLVIFPVLWVSLIALYAGPKKTGVVLAFQGRMQSSEGPPVEAEDMTEEELTRRLRRQALHLVVQAGIVAALGTAVVVVVPV